jgi:transmembrane sensor
VDCIYSNTIALDSPIEIRLQELFSRISWSEEECAWVLGVMEQVPPGELQAIFQEEFMAALSRVRPEDSGRAQTLLAQIHERAGIPAPVRRMGVWRWWVAAAAVVLLLGSLGGLWVMRKPSAPVVHVTVADVAPGGNKAVLTLSGGQKIVLDSAGNGVLAQQGGASVVKVDSGMIVYHGASGVPSFNTLTTPFGGTYALVLPDGSRVWLNAASSITYPTSFSGVSRDVQVTGEAYFEVRHRAGQPFRVAVGAVTIEDVGTQFDVNAYSDEPVVATTLLEGAVRIGGVVLRPGEQAQASMGGSVRVIPQVNTELVTAWRNGRFQFDHADIYTVMRQVARWYDVRVRYEGKVDPGTFTGKIGRDLSLRDLLDGLAQTRVHYRIEDGRTLIITP